MTYQGKYPGMGVPLLKIMSKYYKLDRPLMEEVIFTNYNYGLPFPNYTLVEQKVVIKLVNEAFKINNNTWYKK